MSETSRIPQPMDTVFFDCLDGASAIGVFKQHGPYIVRPETPQGDTEAKVAFGVRDNDASPAYALAATAALAVRAPEWARAKGALQSLAARGAAGIALQSIAMQPALQSVSEGGGQLAGLAVVTNLADKDNSTVLRDALFNASEVTSDQICYPSPAVLLDECITALQRRYNNDDPDRSRLQAYEELLAAKEMPAWLLGLLATAATLKRTNCDMRFSPPVADRLNALSQDPPRLTVCRLAFRGLQLPLRPKQEQSGNAVSPASQAPGSQPAESPAGQQVAVGEQAHRGYRPSSRAIFDEALRRYDDCLSRRERTVGALRSLYRAHPSLSGGRLDESGQNADTFARLQNNPEATYTILDNYTPGNGNDTAASIATAVIESKRMPIGDVAAKNAARHHLMANLDQLLHGSVLDLPGDELYAYGITPDDLIKYVPAMREQRGRGTPSPAHLVQLAAQVVAFNELSVMPLGRMPPVKPNKILRKTPPGAHVAWVAAAQEVSDIAGALQSALSRQYGCTVPLAPHYGHRVNNPSPRDTTFRVLAICAQIDAGAEMPANTPDMQALLNRVDPQTLGSARRTFEQLRAHCGQTPDRQQQRFGNPLAGVAQTARQQWPFNRP